MLLGNTSTQGPLLMPLTDIAIKNAKPKEKPYRMADGEGLCVKINPNGSKHWQLRYNHPVTKKAKIESYGPYPTIGLAEARAKKTESKALLRQGIDPMELKQQNQLTAAVQAAITFELVANEWFGKQVANWAKSHATRTIGLINNNLCPWLGKRPISEITTPELLGALQHTEARGTIETAHRAREVAGQIFRYAAATGRIKYDPTPSLKGALTKRPKEKNFAAITDPERLGDLLLAMDGYRGTPEVKAALQLSPILFQRPFVIRTMEWEEINIRMECWEIPEIKMKNRKCHIVPLPKQAMDILRNMQPITGHGQYVFPSARGLSRPLSENAVRTALRILGYSNDDQTPHGFRATARTLLDEKLGYRLEVIEMQLAHEVKDVNGTAYNRTKFLQERIEMMQGWADYLDTLKVSAKLMQEPW
ncbi:MAG TPA: integrase arm-type DNA-binding domain-containing protein [Pseudomonadales bacterium]|nr:integrase arm-type DNA-binding domain-containing protein [Pseudomonadales bacterium]